MIDPYGQALRRELLRTRVHAHLEGDAMRSMHVDPQEMQDLLDELEALQARCAQLSAGLAPIADAR